MSDQRLFRRGFPTGATTLMTLALGVAGWAAFNQTGPAPVQHSVILVDPARVPRIRPTIDAPGRPVPSDTDDQVWSRKYLGSQHVPDPPYPSFQVIPKNLKPTGHSLVPFVRGPGVEYVQAVLEPEVARKRRIPPHVWKWKAPIFFHDRWDTYGDAGNLNIDYSQWGHERYLTMVTYDLKWRTPPNLLMFDVKAAPVPHGNSPPLWDVQIPLEPLYAALAVERGKPPRFPRKKETGVNFAAGEAYRARVSNTPDGNRILVWLEPEPDVDGVGFWLFDGSGRLLRTIVFPNRYAVDDVQYTMLKRSRGGNFWEVRLAKPVPKNSGGQLQGRRPMEAIEEAYLINTDGEVLGQFVNGRGDPVLLDSPRFTRDDRWAFANYNVKQAGRPYGQNMNCYYDLRPFLPQEPERDPKRDPKQESKPAPAGPTGSQKPKAGIQPTPPRKR